MEIIVHCPQCEYELHLPHRELLGRKGKCPKCEHKFIMQEAKVPSGQTKSPEPRQAPPEKPQAPIAPPPKKRDPQPEIAVADGDSGLSDEQTLDDVSLDSAAIPEGFWDDEPEEPATKDPGRSGVVARCLHCHAAVDFQQDDELRDYRCGHCGKHFSLILPEAPPDDLKMPAKVGGYSLEESSRVGVGPFGSVYRANDAQSQEPIVIKVARGDQVSESEADKFLASLRLGMQLKHQSIATLHELDIAEGRVYLVSSFISGVDLSEYLLGEPNRHLSVRDVASLCALIASVLHHAHKFDVIHGNLKPSNIRLDANQKPCLLDFGLNRRQNAVQVTDKGQIVGSAAYLAPEQLPGTNREPDAQTDVFALGVIFYELLTGRRPFPGEGAEVFKQIARGGPVHPRSINPEVPKSLDTICMKCLEVDPRDRYESAMDLYKELRLYLENKPINTKPPGMLERLGRWCRRPSVL